MRKLRQERTCLAEVTQLVELGFKPRPIRPRAWTSFAVVSASREAGPVPHEVEDTPHFAAGSPQFNWGTLSVVRSQRRGSREEDADALGKPQGQ